MQAFLPDWWIINARALWPWVHSPLVDGWLLARWLAQSLLFSSLVFLADLLAGSAMLRFLGRSLPPALRAATALALGSGLGGFVIFWFGMAGRLASYTPLAVTAALGVAAAALIHRRCEWRWTFCFVRTLVIPRQHWPVVIVLAILFAFPFLMHLMDLVMPVTEFDSTLYHMQAAKHYRVTQSLAYHGGIRYNAHPQLSVLLFLRHWAILGDDALAKLQNLEFALMILLVVIYVARELRWKAGWISGVLFMAASPSLTWISKVEYGDLALCAYVAVTGAILFHHLRRRADLIVPAGLVLGCAASTKLQGHVVAACVGFGFVAASVLRRDRLVVITRAVIVLGIAITLCCGGWWLRSWTATGSPAYPFFVNHHPDVAAMFRNDSAYGLGRDWRAFLLIPWHMLVGPPEAFADAFIFGVPGLILLAAAAAAGLRFRRPPPPEILFLAATIAVYLAFWFSTSQVMRYLASVLPLAAMLFLWFLIRAGASRRLPLWAALPLAVFALHATILTSTEFRRGILPAVTHAQRQQALAAVLPYYQVVRELNRRAAPTDKTYLLFCEEAKYYTRTRTWGDWYGEQSYAWIAGDTRSAADIVSRLRAAGFRWILVARDRARQGAFLFSWEFAKSPFADPAAEFPGVRTVYSDRYFAVFEL